jgi:hypothetical protein
MLAHLLLYLCNSILEDIFGLHFALIHSSHLLIDGLETALQLFDSAAGTSMQRIDFTILAGIYASLTLFACLVSSEVKQMQLLAWKL